MANGSHRSKRYTRRRSNKKSNHKRRKHKKYSVFQQADLVTPATPVAAGMADLAAQLGQMPGDTSFTKCMSLLESYHPAEVIQYFRNNDLLPKDPQAIRDYFANTNDILMLTMTYVSLITAGRFLWLGQKGIMIIILVKLCVAAWVYLSSRNYAIGLGKKTEADEPQKSLT